MERVASFKKKYPYLYSALEFNFEYLGRLVITTFAAYGIAIEFPPYLTYLVLKYGFLGQLFGLLSTLFVMASIVIFMIIPLFQKVWVKPSGQEDS